MNTIQKQKKVTQKKLSPTSAADRILKYLGPNQMIHPKARIVEDHSYQEIEIIGARWGNNNKNSLKIYGPDGVIWKCDDIHTVSAEESSVGGQYCIALTTPEKWRICLNLN